MKVTPIKKYSSKSHHPVLNEANYKIHLPNLVHTTAFFRYNDIDEFIISKLKQKQISKKEPLNILSAGCSFGEEVYSYAIALDDKHKKPNITGIDISKTVIEEAKIGRYKLDEWERALLSPNHNTPNFLKNQAYIENIKRNFNRNFECINPTTSEFQKRSDCLQNCNFISGNILNLSDRFEKNSQDAILCRYVLYQLDKKDLDKFFKQAYEILKPGGLLCVEPFGYPKYQPQIIQAGFIQPYNEAPCVFKKPKNPHTIGEYYKQKIVRPEFNGFLNRISEFDDIQHGFEENLFVHL